MMNKFIALLGLALMLCGGTVAMAQNSNGTVVDGSGINGVFSGQFIPPRNVRSSTTYNAATDKVTFRVEVTPVNTDKKTQLILVAPSMLNASNIQVKINGQVASYDSRIPTYYIKSTSHSYTIEITATPIDRTKPIQAHELKAATTSATQPNAPRAPSQTNMTTYNYLYLKGAQNGDFIDKAPEVGSREIELFRGETYPGEVVTATDDKGIASITATGPAPDGGTFSSSGATLSLTGTVALDANRANPNSSEVTTHTITATDTAGKTATGTLKVTLRPQTDAYEATGKTNQSVGYNTTLNPVDLVASITKRLSSLPDTAQNVRYSWEGTPITTNSYGTKTGSVRVTYEDGSYDIVNVSIIIEAIPVATGSEFTVYRGEDYGNVNNRQPFFTGRPAEGDNTKVTGINPRSTPNYPPGTQVTAPTNIPVRQDNSHATIAYLRGREGVIVPLNAQLGTAEYGFTAQTGVAPNDKYSSIAKVIIHTKAQTDAYDAKGITGKVVNRGTAVTAKELVSVDKIASTLPNIPEGASYEFTDGTSIDTSTVGTKTAKVKVTYADGSIDVVNVSVVVKAGNPPTATGRTITVYRGDAYLSGDYVTATDSDGTIKQVVPASTPAYPPTISGYPVGAAGVGTANARLIGNTSSKVSLSATLGEANYIYRFEDNEGNITPATLVVITKAQTDAYDAKAVTGKVVKRGTVVTAKELVSVDKIASTLPNIPEGASYEFTDGTTIDTSTVGTKTAKVKVTYQDGSIDIVNVSVVVNTGVTPTATGSTITVYRGASYPAGTYVTASDSDGTITTVYNSSTPAYPPTITGLPVQVTGRNTANVRLIGNTSSKVSLDATLGEASYLYRFKDNDGNISPAATLVVITKAQTDAYNATGKTGTEVNKGTTITPSNLVDIVKEYSTLPNAPQNATYTWEGTPVDTSTAGTKTGKIKITYEDSSIDIVTVSVKVNETYCVKPANTTGTALNTTFGITDFATPESNGNLNDGSSWPMIRKGGWIALESNTKGLVITRMTTAQINAISAPQEGMMVYDTTAKCLKLYNGTAWKCFSKPVCPTF